MCGPHPGELTSPGPSYWPTPRLPSQGATAALRTAWRLSPLGPTHKPDLQNTGGTQEGYSEACSAQVPHALPARQGLQWLLPALLFPFTLVFKPKVKLNRMWETGSTEARERRTPASDW